MRLAEAFGLLISDLHIQEDIPFLRLEEHASRPLKTAGSRRDIPLVGSALWAVQRAANENNGPFLFPRYCSATKCKADYASNTLNKWMKPFVPDGCVIHSFRHSLRDRLRACECPSDIIDQIGGWAPTSVGQGYGSGYPLANLLRWMKNLEGTAGRQQAKHEGIRAVQIWEWRVWEAAYLMCLPSTLRFLDPANLFCNTQCTTVCITAAGSRVAKRTPDMCPGGLPQRVCTTKTVGPPRRGVSRRSESH